MRVSVVGQEEAKFEKVHECAALKQAVAAALLGETDAPVAIRAMRCVPVTLPHCEDDESIFSLQLRSLKNSNA